MLYLDLFPTGKPKIKRDDRYIIIRLDTLTLFLEPDSATELFYQLNNYVGD